MKNKTNDQIVLILMILIVIAIVGLVVGLITYSINAIGLEEFIARLKRLEKWMW